MSLQHSSRRILRDLKEWRECSSEVPTIIAAPLDTDIFIWHANMIAADGPLKGIRFHLIITFPNNYPYKPPSIELCNYLKHPNVFKSGIHGNTTSNHGYWICLDLLKQNTRSEKYKGWTPAYSILSILLQLQSFLMGEKIEQMHGAALELKSYLSPSIIEEIRKESHKYQCNKCNIFHKNPIKNQYILHKSYNNIADNDDYKELELELSNMSIQKNKQHRNMWKRLYDDVENVILCFLTYKDCVYFYNVCKQFQVIIERNKIFELNRFGCWYHKIDLNYCSKTLNKYKNNKNDQVFEDEQVLNNIVLGYGFTPKFFSGLSYSPYFSDHLKDIDISISKSENLKFLRLQKCEITFDLLSYNAFNKHQIRTTVWKEQNFTHFLPIFINKKHGEKSMKLFEILCYKIFAQQAINNPIHYVVPKSYHPMMGIHLLMTIMAYLVVSVTRHCDNNYGNIYIQNLHHSINVIETFMHLYHMLLAVYVKYCNIISPIIEEKCIHFLNYEKYRKKEYIPSFGEFKLYFVLCNKQRYEWDKLVHPFVEEAFIRKVKWVVKEYSSLRTVALNDDKDYRINKTWNSSKKRGFMFSYFFLNHVVKMDKKSPFETFKQFNENFGCPPKNLAAEFQKFIKKIYLVENIYQFFAIIEINNMTKESVYNLLSNACKKSLLYGYHKKEARRRRYHW